MITGLSGTDSDEQRMSDRRSICETRKRVDSILAGPPLLPMVPIHREPAFLREAMIQLRQARGRLGGATPRATIAELSRDPIAEFILTEANTIDLRVEASQADHNLRLARLAGRAAAILDQIARERARADAQAALAGTVDGDVDPAVGSVDAPSGSLIPSHNWDETLVRRLTQSIEHLQADDAWPLEDAFVVEVTPPPRIFARPENFEPPAFISMEDPSPESAAAADAIEASSPVMADDGFANLEELAATLRLLGSLRDEGLVTDAEFEAKKAELLARI